MKNIEKKGKKKVKQKESKNKIEQPDIGCFLLSYFVVVAC